MTKILKADLHVHTCDGVIERDIPYNAFMLIDRAVGLGYEVLSITNHDTVTYSDYLNDYAKERGILLIPGAELTINRKHVVAYNIGKKIDWIKNFNDLEKIKNKDNLFMAPHPFYPCHKSLRRHLVKWIHLFDVIELSHFYSTAFDFNRKAISFAKKFNLPLIGTSDCHSLHQLNRTFTLINAEKDQESIFEAIKSGCIEIVTTPLSLFYTGKILCDLIIRKYVCALLSKVGISKYNVLDHKKELIKL